MDQLLYQDENSRIHACRSELNGIYRLVWTDCDLFVPVHRAYISDKDVPTCEKCLAKGVQDLPDSAEC